MSAYEYPLLLKNVLESGVNFVPNQKIVYRDEFEYTYAEMYDRVLRLGAALQQMGVKKGSTVGIIEWDSHRYLEMYFGVPGVGAIMHTINPLLSPSDLVYTMLHAEDEVLIFNEDFLPLIEKIRPQLATVKHYIIIAKGETPPETNIAETDYETMLKSAVPLPELPDFDENTQATLAYTTGTTGKPKGVYFSHRQLVLHTLVEAASFGSLTDFGGVTKNDVYMPLTPLFHVHAWGVPYTMTMLGLKQIYPGRYDPEMLLKLIVGHKVSISHCVPTILQMITSAPAAKKFDLSQWKVVIGGARLPKGLAKTARDELGIKIYAGYGMSETAPLLTLAFIKPTMGELTPDEELDIHIKTGLPVPLVKLRVATPDGEEVAHDGKERGEIQVRTPWLTPSYYKEPEKGKVLWEGGWLHTGDVANVNQEGYIQIVDRLKDVIKSGGEWISSLELENLISLQEGVSEVAVIGVPDEKWGERPMAIIVPKPDFKGKLTGDDIVEHLKKFVEDGTIIKWAVPERYEFVEAIPKTSVGKIDKKVLRSEYGGGI
jgi:fatty-acyl-CoA synthase